MGQKIDFFKFRVRWLRKSRGAQGIMAKQTAPREAAVSPSSGRFQVVWGRTCGVHWQTEGSGAGGVDQRLEASLRCCRVTPRARGKAPQQTQWGYVRDRSGPQGRSRRGRSVGRWGPGAEGSGSDAPSTREPTDCHPQMFLTRRRRVVRAVQVTELPVANRPPTRSSRGCGTPAALSAR